MVAGAVGGEAMWTDESTDPNGSGTLLALPLRKEDQRLYQNTEMGTTTQ